MQIALTSLYLACKVEELPTESIKTLAEFIKRDLKLNLIHFNTERKKYIKTSYFITKTLTF